MKVIAVFAACAALFGCMTVPTRFFAAGAVPADSSSASCAPGFILRFPQGWKVDGSGRTSLSAANPEGNLSVDVSRVPGRMDIFEAQLATRASLGNDGCAEVAESTYMIDASGKRFTFFVRCANVNPDRIGLPFQYGTVSVREFSGRKGLVLTKSWSFAGPDPQDRDEAQAVLETLQPCPE